MSAQYGELRPTSGWDRFGSLRRWTEGATYIRQGDHHVGHWRTFQFCFISRNTKDSIIIITKWFGGCCWRCRQSDLSMLFTSATFDRCSSLRIAISVSVCLSVCLYARISHKLRAPLQISWNSCTCYLQLLLWWQCNMLCILGSEKVSHQIHGLTLSHFNRFPKLYSLLDSAINLQ